MFFFFLICVVSLCHGPTAQAQALTDGEFKFPRNRNVVRIPFKLIHNLVIIPLRINKSKTLNFIVDTGVETAILTELGEHDSVMINSATPLKLYGLGRGKSIEALTSMGNRFQLGDLEANGQPLLVLSENIFNLSLRIGMEVHGMIGHSLFKNSVVEIDYQNKLLSIYKQGFYPEKKKLRATRLPLQVENNKPYVEVQVLLPNGEKQPLRLVIDSGLSASMLLYLPTMPNMKKPETHINAYLGRGLNGDIHGVIGRIKGFQLGSYNFQNLPASFPDSLSIMHALTLNNRNGNLGADVLQRFTVVFDYANSELLLKPNSKYGSPFFFNLSGMEIMCPIPGLKIFSVAAVMPDSPAEKAGLKPGDTILSVNGIRSGECTLEEMLHLFQSRPGKKLKIQVRRQLQTLKTTLVLQDMI